MRSLFLTVVVLLVLALAGLEIVATHGVLADARPESAASAP